MTDHLTCQDVLDLVEPIAAGDVAVDGAVRGHLETCPRCASALASARRLDTLLAARTAPTAPPQFTQAVLVRIRRERWQTEQHVDRIFNVAIAAAVVLVAAAVTALFNVDGILRAAAAAWAMMTAATKEGVGSAAPVFRTYIAAAAFMASALAMWWWAERRLSL
jgi:anti-sigma factor RsiW